MLVVSTVYFNNEMGHSVIKLQTIFIIHAWVGSHNDSSERAKKMQIHVTLERPTLIIMHQQDMNASKCSKLKLSAEEVG